MALGDSKFASRKWAVAVFLILMAPVLRWAGLLDQAGLLTIWGGAMAGYFVANVAQKIVTPNSSPD